MATSGIDFSDLGGHRVSPPATIDFSDLGGKRILTPPAAINNAASKKWNPVEEAKTRWDLSDYDDPTIYKHLSDPATFRSTFPEYDHLGDDEIAAGMQRTGARNPNYVGTGIKSPFGGSVRQGAPPSPTINYDDNKDIGVRGAALPEPISRFAIRTAAKLATDIPSALKSAITHPYPGPNPIDAYHEVKRGWEGLKNDMQGKATPGDSEFPLQPEQLGIDSKAVAEAARNKDWPGLAAETAVPLAENIGLGKLLGAGESSAVRELPTATERTMVRGALRPADKDLRFDQHVNNAWGDIQQQVKANAGPPKTLDDFDNMLVDAKKKVWGEYADIKNRAAATRPNIKGELPAASTEVATGVQQVKGEAAGGALPATSRPTLAVDPDRPRRNYISDPENLPGGNFSTEPMEVGGRPQGVAASPQYLSGSAHPEMSGRLTNPATFQTRSTAQLTSIRDRLGAVIDNSEHFSSLSPSEQEAYRSQYNRINGLLQPGPRTPYGPTISGNVIADAINKSIRPRAKAGISGPAAELSARSQRYRELGQIPINAAEEYLQDANREASSWYAQATRDPHGPAFGASSAAEASAIREQMYKMIDSLPGVDPGTARNLKARYGALDALHDYTAKRIPVASRQAPINLLEGGGIMAGLHILAQAHDARHVFTASLPYLTARAVRHLNSPEFLLRRSVSPTRVPVLIRQFAAGTAARPVLEQK